jgi:isopentenyl phosphate kinase
VAVGKIITRFATNRRGADHVKIGNMSSELIFLKLGGSLITDKSLPKTPRLEVIHRLAVEVFEAVRRKPEMHLLIGHGSGSFGHATARRYGTAGGVKTQTDWLGFSEVWKAADALNRLVMDALGNVGLPVIRIAPSGAALANAGSLVNFPHSVMQSAWDAGMLPVIYGDVVFDRAQGGAIASTEEIFSVLARAKRPHRILLAGTESGVYSDYPVGQSLISSLSSSDKTSPLALMGSAHADVTGGMRTKVKMMLSLVAEGFTEEALIFSGEQAGNVVRALLGEEVEGTRIIK